MKKTQNSIFNMPSRNMRFDIPLHARVGTEFLMLLMGLMTFLCILAGCISLSLNNMAKNWTSGLADTITIEIPFSKADARRIGELTAALSGIPGIAEARLLDRDELQSLVEPWLGTGSNALHDLPVPSLINVRLTERTDGTMAALSEQVTASIPDAKIDAHDHWLSDIVKLAKALQIAGTSLIIIIGIVTAMTVSGAVRSRMAIHHSELELLHIMGASDNYITRQFQKYIFVLSGKGIALGMGLSALALLIVHFLSANLPETLPRLNITSTHAVALPFIAFLLLAISVMAAKRTVMGVLKEMP